MAFDFAMIEGVAPTTTRAFRAFADGFARRTRAIAAALEGRMDATIAAWTGVALLVAAAKVIAAPNPGGSLWVTLTMSLPFLAAAASPVLGYRVASALFPRGKIRSQPGIRLCRYGSWRSAAPAELRQAEGAGPAGFLVSLIVGLMLNVPVRSLEFLTVVPAVNPGDPHWAQVLLMAMTCDVTVMNFAYMACFVMALRGVPLLPRALLVVWALDIGTQIAMAGALAHANLPQDLVGLLSGYLDGNVKKVMISVFVWLPYLILSDQVNLLFRHRVRAAP